MMRTIALVTLFLLLILTVSVLAQEAPRAEIFGGYQFTRASTGVSGIDNFNLNGWDAAVSGYFNRYLGVTGDFSGTYGGKIQGIDLHSHLYTYMFGPVVRVANKGPFQPFAHVLFGGAHVSASVSEPGFSGSGSDSGFAWAAGGGLDFKAVPLISIRVAQFDFLQTHISGESQNNFRYSAGVVLRF
jgi:opacity protein-like surface antigen